MDEKKVELTDEEIVKALECMATSDSGTSGYTVNIAPYALDLIHRLQDEINNLLKENEELTISYHGVQNQAAKRIVEITTQVDKLTNENAEQKAKIERLKKGQAESAKTAVEVLEQNIELQKQVGELKEQFLSTCENCHLKKDLELLRYQKEQAVKDTAKEIYLRVKNKSGAELSFLNDLALWIKERFGVAVEKWIKVDGVEVE